MHLDKLTRLKMQGHVRAGTHGKSIVAGLLERDGKAKVKVMPNVRAYHMRSNVVENVEKGSLDALREPFLTEHVNTPRKVDTRFLYARTKPLNPEPRKSTRRSCDP
jgi:hypothetical protein